MLIRSCSPYLEEEPGVNHLAHLLLGNGALSSSEDGEGREREQGYKETLF